MKKMLDNKESAIVLNNLINDVKKLIILYNENNIIEFNSLYKIIKSELKKRANECIDFKPKHDFYNTVYIHSIKEANAFGFGENVNSKDLLKKYYSVLEAEYKLEKICTQEELKKYL